MSAASYEMRSPDAGRGRGGRGFGRGRGRQDGSRRLRKPDPQPCPISTDEDGNLKIKATILILRENAGAVIGHRGDHVADVRKETGAFVHVCEPNHDTGIQGVDVMGRIPQVIAAQAKIAAVLGDNAAEWAADREWGPRLVFHLLPDMASVVIGKKGSTIQNIQRQSGANVRVAREQDAQSLQKVQVFGTNEDATAAFAMVINALGQYNAADSRSIPQLRDRWDRREGADGGAPPPDVYSGGSGGGAGGAAPRGGYAVPRSSGASGRDRYDPYSGGPRSAPRFEQDGGRGVNGGTALPAGVQAGPSSGPVVVMQGSQGFPQGSAGPMPTVLLQQADGTLVQAQVVSHQGGEYSVQPATQLQGALAQVRNDNGLTAPYVVNAGSGHTHAGSGQMHPMPMQMMPQGQGQAQPGMQVMYAQPGDSSAQQYAQPQFLSQPPQYAAQPGSAPQQPQYVLPSSAMGPGYNSIATGALSQQAQYGQGGGAMAQAPQYMQQPGPAPASSYSQGPPTYSATYASK